MGCSMPGFPVHHQLPELSQTRVHRVSDAIQPSHPLSSPSPSAFSLSQHAPGCHAAKRKPLSLPGMVSDRNGRGRVFHREPWGEKAQQRQGTLLLLLLGAGRRLEARPALQESDKIKKDTTEPQDLAGVPWTSATTQLSRCPSWEGFVEPSSFNLSILQIRKARPGKYHT